MKVIKQIAFTLRARGHLDPARFRRLLDLGFLGSDPELDLGARLDDPDEWARWLRGPETDEPPVLVGFSERSRRRIRRKGSRRGRETCRHSRVERDYQP